MQSEPVAIIGAAEEKRQALLAGAKPVEPEWNPKGRPITCAECGHPSGRFWGYDKDKNKVRIQFPALIKRDGKYWHFPCWEIAQRRAK